ncbi:branched-chain alpha-keto acid dehydrogenase subunit E2 [Streptomyces sp. Ru73]|uniref:dihydrolipoamide acetyltransferase family protein n=1 Tax=Streptomyces sp. Ru73 TaxID=2080748 RepID=UPI000CDD14F9|nr:dihydrolipoamide acetyltransferase family protein [Streptomyces sp. Ru73]POX42143.1 branched-chain alpha-keto acid dehydrogenase subunit E2 [Streptomyces sp. Ru73]
MAEVREFPLPDLGEGLTEATIVRWLVEVGEVVAVDQPVVEVETAKAMVEVPCPYGGVVTARMGKEGDELPVGAPLVTVAVGESRSAGAEAGEPADPAAEQAEGSGNVLVGYGTSAPAGRRRRVRPSGPGRTGGGTTGAGERTAASRDTGAGRTEPAGTGGARPHAVAGAAAATGPTAAPGADVAEHPEAEGPVPVISPLVRRLAREHGVDLRTVRGSGPEGLILRADVERAVRVPEQTAAAEAVPTASGTAAPAGAERLPLKGMRGAAAEKFARSRREIPDATCWVDADATELLAVRRAMNAGGGPKVSLLALLARICTAALARFPELNSTVDTAAREIVRLPEVHLGFAAQTDRGLVVPVVRHAHARTVEGLSAEMARLTETAREGRLSPAELTHGTFTLNNYGVFGVDGSTPIINHPEAAMLGVGRIAAKPWVHEGELAVRSVVQLSLTFDHRVCDGGTAGGFLRFVADCVEQPAVLLRGL